MSNITPSVFVFDDMHPEDLAMSQALYSRSPDSIVEHRKKVEEVGSGRFIEQYYVGYGHASIGDCGSTTLFLENVSMLVAKAIQDNGLYRGQEASTRYLDFSTQPQYDPYDHPASKYILSRWLDLYNQYMPLTIEGLKQRYLFNATTDKNEKVWLKTIEVRAFDILRSLLPVGTTTLLSWHTDLRQARDHLRHLSNHPLPEVRDVANTCFKTLKAKYPHSFQGEEMDPDSEYYHDRNEYAKDHALVNHYLTPNDFLDSLTDEGRRHVLNGYVETSIETISNKIRQDDALYDRPRGAPLPRRFIKYGVSNFDFLLDFGSFRDLQRHRNGYCPVPLVTNDFGFYEGYRKALEDALSIEDYYRLMEDIDDQLIRINSLTSFDLDTNAVKDQYLYPMGMACGCTVSYSVPQTVYVSELRSGKTVHFTLRPIAHAMARHLQHIAPDLNLYVDWDEDSFTVKRGEQTITAKV